jgi:hypothetical protein
MRKIFVIFLILICSCKSSKLNYNWDSGHTSTENYKISELDSTPNYYILKASDQKNKKYTIIVEKLSRQIKSKKITVDRNYILSTRSLYDDVFGGNYYHTVEGKKVWESKNLDDLRFTESMGNENDTIINGKEIINGKKQKIVFGHN